MPVRFGPAVVNVAQNGERYPLGMSYASYKFAMAGETIGKFGTGLTVLSGVGSASSGYLGAMDNGDSVAHSASIGAAEGVGDTVIGLGAAANGAAIGALAGGPVGAGVGAVVGLGLAYFSSNAFNDAVSRWL